MWNILIFNMAVRKIASLAQRHNQGHAKDTILINKLMKITKRKKTTCNSKYPNYLIAALLQSTVDRLEFDMARVESRLARHWEDVDKKPKDTQSC